MVSDTSESIVEIKLRFPVQCLLVHIVWLIAKESNNIHPLSLSIENNNDEYASILVIIILRTGII